GRLVYYKGVDVLVDALALAPGVRVAIAGIGPLAAELRKRADALGLGERVVFLNEVSAARLHALYKAMAFLILPSVAPSEAFGMVQLEAMATGRPVISTDLPSGVPYVNQHGRTGILVPPRDPHALAAAMRLLTSDRSYRESLGGSAEQRVRAE